MPASRDVQVKDGDVLVLVGTMKGAFLFRSNGARRNWDVAGPYFPGHAVYTMAYDSRAGRRRLWASAACSENRSRRSGSMDSPRAGNLTTPFAAVQIPATARSARPACNSKGAPAGLATSLMDLRRLRSGRVLAPVFRARGLW